MNLLLEERVNTKSQKHELEEIINNTKHKFEQETTLVVERIE